MIIQIAGNINPEDIQRISSIFIPNIRIFVCLAPRENVRGPQVIRVGIDNQEKPLQNSLIRALTIGRLPDEELWQLVSDIRPIESFKTKKRRQPPAKILPDKKWLKNTRAKKI